MSYKCPFAKAANMCIRYLLPLCHWHLMLSFAAYADAKYIFVDEFVENPKSIFYKNSRILLISKKAFLICLFYLKRWYYTYEKNK